MDLGIADSCPQNLQGISANLFLTLVNTLMSAKCPLGSLDQYPPDYGPKLLENEEFDFVVVGGGSAGSVVVNRLTENGKWRVLLLEAGGYPSAVSDIPGLLFSMQGTQEDWQYKTEPSENSCVGLKDGVCLWPRGNVLGGSSSLNAMLYIRGTKRDYEKWAQLGNVGWDWNNVRSHFQKLEYVQEDILPKSTQYGRNGYQILTKYHSGEPVQETVKEAARELQYPSLPEEDPNRLLGYFESLSTIKGTRINAAKAFLGPIKDKNNLFVSVNSLVTKILIDKKTKVAKGVEVKINGKNLKVYVKKEVVVSGGTINSAQLLMLSGIGPRNHLERLNIDTIMDLPVGENLQDHSNSQVFAIKMDHNSYTPVSPYANIDELYKYFIYRKGKFSEISVTNLLGFINTKNNSNNPDIQFMHALYRPNDNYLMQEILRTINIGEETANSLFEAKEKNPLFFFLPVVINPESRGRIMLKSKNPLDKPSIEACYFNDKNGEDLEKTLNAIRFLEKLVHTGAFSKHNPEIFRLKIPKCDHLEFRTDEYWYCAIRQMTSTIYHPVGTCKMGPEGDETAVVDPRLRVHGVKNLRVVDASIMPLIVSVNTNGPTLMIGHKGGQMIIDDWSLGHTEL